ncbi:MAG TPA: phosphopentomutase [Armatimonadota bacterium]|nr:phosphopentomutase [Armatimonadota bacterium]
MGRPGRVILITLDGCGIGEMPDAAEYGDVGSNTIANTARALGGFDLPNLQLMGLGNLADIPGVLPNPNPTASFGVMLEKSRGKDTIIGHWEIAGIITERPFPLYPHGFPQEIMTQFEQAIGRGILGNYAASGTEIIKQLGEEHMRTGRPIVYTSADSVFQIAAHEDVIPVEALYDMCLKAREILTGEHNVARVIARPFVGEPENFRRTANRRDFAVKPPKPTVLDSLIEHGFPVIGIGKIGDIFAYQGISKSIHTESDLDGINRTIEAIRTAEPGLIFTNLVDFDAVYGHRNDPQGFADNLRQFDDHLPAIRAAMRDNDLLLITADHGVDPTTPSTDHSREKVPLLVYGKSRPPRNLGERATFADIAATIADLFGLPPWPVGIPIVP